MRINLIGFKVVNFLNKRFSLGYLKQIFQLEWISSDAYRLIYRVINSDSILEYGFFAG